MNACSLIMGYGNRSRGVLDPGGVTAISPGSRVFERTRGPRPTIPTPEGSQRRCDPSGVDPRFDAANRWYRCAQPPANRCDPSGVNTGERLRGMLHRTAYAVRRGGRGAGVKGSVWFSEPRTERVFERSKRPCEWRHVQCRWYISISTRYPLNPGLWMTRPFRSETVCREDVTGPGVSWVRCEIGVPRFE